jgi:hypothetical protein
MSLVLELILHKDTSYDLADSIELDIVNHVHKRVERFIYTDAIRSAGVPIVYLENRPFDSRSNLRIANRTYNVPANSSRLALDRAGYDTVTGKAYSSPYEKVAVTNKIVVDERGSEKPLFFRHRLPTGTVECQLQRHRRGNKSVIETGYILDLDEGNVYTNYENYFDADSGSYRLFSLVCTTADGTAYHQMLNPEPVAKLADWEDIDLTTGTLTTDYPVYSIEQGTGGWNIYFGTTDTWHIKPLERSLIQPIHPSGRDANEEWFLRFSAGNLSAVVNDQARRYSLPEYHAQPFSPSKPTVYSPYKKLIPVNDSVVAATQKSLSINPSSGLHIDIIIENVDGVVVHALTTDVSKEGVRYSENVYWESDKIQSWDNAGGFIMLGIKLLRSWSLSASYYYEATDFEYTLVSLNPLTNKRARNHTYVFYLIPDVHVNDRALHHLVLDYDGRIVYTSQGPSGVAYSNLQMTDAGGNYNSDTVIGLKYISDIETDTFLTRYAAGFSNSFGYMLLAETAVVETSLEEHQTVVSVSRRGGVPVPDELDNVLRSNSRIAHSLVMGRPKGQEVPRNAVMILDAPLSLLEDYGGPFTENQAEIYLRTHIPAAGYGLVNWTYPKTILSGTSLLTSQVELSWTWEGPTQTYTLYRRDVLSGEKTVVYNEIAPAEGALSYTNTGLVSGTVYHYSISITEDGIEYPESNLLSVKVR